MIWASYRLWKEICAHMFIVTVGRTILGNRNRKSVLLTLSPILWTYWSTKWFSARAVIRRYFLYFYICTNVRLFFLAYFKSVLWLSPTLKKWVSHTLLILLSLPYILLQGSSVWWKWFLVHYFIALQLKYCTIIWKDIYLHVHRLTCHFKVKYCHYDEEYGQLVRYTIDSL